VAFYQFIQLVFCKIMSTMTYELVCLDEYMGTICLDFL